MAKKKICYTIFRASRKDPRTGKILYARTYGLKAWPITICKETTEKSAASQLVNTVQFRHKTVQDPRLKRVKRKLGSLLYWTYICITSHFIFQEFFPVLYIVRSHEKAIFQKKTFNVPNIHLIALLSIPASSSIIPMPLLHILQIQPLISPVS